jgi:diguanylate cyclase (GGDEF)-like protein/PAS domain S-box-containing protein
MKGATPTNRAAGKEQDLRGCEDVPAGDVAPATANFDLEEALRRERSLLRTIIDSIPSLIYAKDTHSRFIACNVLAARGMGTTPAEAIGKTDFEFFPEEMATGFFLDEQAVIRSGQPLIEREESVLDRSSGTTRYFATTKVPYRDQAGNIIGIVGIGRDITERKLADERIRYLATHDYLTDLPNRGSFNEALNTAIASARAHAVRFALLFVDLDHFKFINDAFGHEAGDTLLKQIATRLRAAVGPHDLLARLGGDEFVLLCKNPADMDDLDGLATRILQATTRPIALLGQERRVSASIGIAVYPDDGATERTLMKSADTAMYTAKLEGKNNYRLFSSRLKAESLERSVLENELRRALENQELLVHYLPKLDLKSRTITGAEALLRWSHPDLGVLPPARFLTLAQQTGLIVPIGTWVLKTVCAQHMAWRRAGLPPIQISVNLTPQQLNDEHLVPAVLSALAESGMPPQMLELEFSEIMLLQRAVHTSRTLNELKRAGVKLAIHNFGASYLSLTSSSDFPLDTLKVDRSLLHDIDQLETRAFAEAIIAIGKSLNLTVVAEGVERVDQVAFARERACDAIQGFYISQPATADDFGAILRAQAAHGNPRIG